MKNRPARFLTFAAIAILEGCVGGLGLQATGTLWDENVSAELRARLDVLDTRVADAIRAGDASAMLQLVPAPYRARWGAPDALARSFETLKKAEIGSPPPLWHVVQAKFSSASGTMATLPPKVLTAADAFFAYADAVRDSVAITFRKVTLQGEQVLLAATWVPEGDGWGLYALQTGMWSLGGNDALKWYDEVVRLKGVGKPVAAAIRGQLVQQLLRPVATMQYVRQPDIVDDLQALQKQLSARYTWPVAVEGAGDKVSLYRLDPFIAMDDHSFNVVVLFVSPGAALSDAAVSKEAAALHPRVLAMFPDVCEGAKRIVYRACQEPPVDPKRSYNFYSVPMDCPAR